MNLDQHDESMALIVHILAFMRENPCFPNAEVAKRFRIAEQDVATLRKNLRKTKSEDAGMSSDLTLKIVAAIQKDRLLSNSDLMQMFGVSKSRLSSIRSLYKLPCIRPGNLARGISPENRIALADLACRHGVSQSEMLNAILNDVRDEEEMA